MPPLRLFGRSWHISSDDLALPGIAGILFHGTWSVLITAQVATIGLPDDCPQRSWASSSILWLLASFVLTTALQVWVTAASLRGGMLEEHKRKNVPTAMYCLLSAYCLEAAALTYTTVVFEGLVGDVDKCYLPEELARTAVPDLAVHRWFIFTTWAMLAVVGGLLVLLYNLYPDRSLDAWVDRVHCLSYVLCCWRSLGAQDRADGSSNTATPTVLRLAKVFGDVSVDLDLLEEALHWHRYANAIYGWPMFLWSHRYRALRCCRLCCGGCYRCMQRGVELHGRTSSSASLGTEVDGLTAPAGTWKMAAAAAWA
ncbi:hypothetical protein OEZ85_009951 [Tetradesmus obliquus]|uniref:Uncharacterized protein n=1 Tax=Tetradesmus obliquus TaxID=3088 RepID=A0ABY8UFP1_TETOB|nr:hypothetical protein OEZ85_009951 [Tetradesmus obliquus]